MHQHPHDTINPQYVTVTIVSPNGGLKAAPSPPPKKKSEHTRQKEVNSTGWWYMLTCELDLLCTTIAVVLATNL
jgi:hypothetical protein